MFANDNHKQRPSFRDSLSSKGNSVDSEEEEIIIEPDDEVGVSTRIKLRLSAKSLPLVGRLKRRPDCWCVVSLLGSTSRSRHEQMVGQTEEASHNTCPHWTETFILNYDYGTKLYFKVKVLRKSNSQGQKMVGSALFEVSDVLSCNKIKVKRFPEGGGILFARLRILGSDEDKSAMFRFQLKTMELTLPNMRMDMDLMLELCRLRVRKFGDAWVVVYRSPVLQDATLPLFEVAEIALDSGISDEELRWPIRFMIWDKQRRVLVGSVETTLHGVLDSLVTEEFVEPSERDFVVLRRGKTRGRLRVVKAEIVTSEQESEEFNTTVRIAEDEHVSAAEAGAQIPSTSMAQPVTTATFQSYLDQQGYDLKFCVAIDLTSSNGDPRSEDSLHFMLDDQSNNDYQEVIQEVGETFSHICKTHEHLMWGFGAKFDGKVRHIFQCGPTQSVHGVSGMQDAYRSIFGVGMIMSGPTVYDTVIQAAAIQAKASNEQEKAYTVLLIITNGGSIDMAETKRKISLYSDLPMSIVFIGVGRGDFNRMNELTVSSSSCRNTVTMLELRNYQHDDTALAKAALSAVMYQMVDYLDGRGRE